MALITNSIYMIEFNNKIDVKISEKWVTNIVTELLSKLSRRGDVSVVLVGDREIKRLNKRYRRKDEVTDVLAFSNLEGGKMVMPGKERYLGEVIIGGEQAKRQAKEQAHSVKKELMILLIHGVLHLLGYEHEGGGGEEARMKRKEMELLKMF